MKILRVMVAAIAMSAVLPASAEHECEPITRNHSIEAHAETEGHRRLCHDEVVGQLEVTANGGLGQIDVDGNIAAVVQRDEGLVAFIDISRPSRPKVIGRYEDDVSGSLDGDVAFSDNGDWLFYARQTSNFDEDGVHVLNTTNRAAPSLSMYQPAGGAFRIEYYKDDEGGEWVVLLDAIEGLVVYRFVPDTGTIAKVFQDATPALKVGGPASAGLFISKHDPMSGSPLLYVTTGQTGLQIYDFTNPAAPEIVGEWSDVGLADVDVAATKRKRRVFAATEYWFDSALPPEVIVLDAKDVDAIKKRRVRSLGVPADDLWRVQGIHRTREGLYVAHSHAGVIRFKGRQVTGVGAVPEPHNEGAGYNASPYAMDVVMDRRGYRLVTDASSGTLTILVPFSDRDLDGG